MHMERDDPRMPQTAAAVVSYCMGCNRSIARPFRDLEAFAPASCAHCGGQSVEIVDATSTLAEARQRALSLNHARGAAEELLDVLGGIDEPLRARPEIDAGDSKRFPASSLPSSFVNSRLATHTAII